MPLSKLYIEEDLWNHPLAVSIRRRTGLPAERVADARTVFAVVQKAADPVQAGKQMLLVTRNRGAFIRPCPGTRHYTCCNYRILHVGSFCSMDCAYCILQAYFHPPVLQFFVNHEDMFKELRKAFKGPDIRRIGTGEFTDSLIWEQWTDLNARLVPEFARQKQMCLELKTKTASVDCLESLAHNRKTIVSWSLNPEPVIAGDERGTASLQERLAAAARCQQWGYPLGFHLDPVILYPGCEGDYRRLIDRVFRIIDPAGVVWISLGSLRFMPALKPIIRQRFAHSKIVYGEFVTGKDGKMRYFKPLRIDLYRQIIRRIKARAPGVCVYFCMEDEEVWKKALGFTPRRCGGLPRMLDRSAILHCDLRAG